MRSLHYPIALPGDFDMRAIARRVEEKAHLFEAVPGLRFKAFLASSRAQGAARNAYAPFYVWDDDAAAQAFLQGPLFAGVIESFGRPAVLDRPVLAFAPGDLAQAPRLATLETVAPAAHEQVDTDLLLQALHLQAHRGLRAADALGRLRERARLVDGQHGLQQAGIDEGLAHGGTMLE